MKKFYITAAIPYVNAAPHIGHALEFVQTDVIARLHKLLGEDALMLSGGDENALKNVQAAEAAGIPIQKFVDKNTEIFNKLTKELNTEFDIWQKGSDKENHFPSSQKLWKRCEDSGDIYKKKYEGLYCVGCETFYSKEDLDDKGECPEHPGKKLQKIAEENYFFKLSRYESKLIKLVESDKLKIIPKTRKNEVLSFLKGGLKDISISRTNERAKNWGVPVPNDSTQRIYVWFDALNIYQSGIGFGWDEKKYNKWWPADVHVIGKGITRFHAIYWPAFLLSANLKLPKTIFIHGYFTVEGQKISKSIGNVIDPLYLIKTYGADTLRYYFLAKFNPFTDGDFSEEKLKHVYNSDLANGLGNLAARVAKLCERSEISFKNTETLLNTGTKKVFSTFRFDRALEEIWTDIRNLDQKIEETRPLELEGDNLKKNLENAVSTIRNIAYNLKPFLPKTAEKIEKQFAGPKIEAGKPLFPRLT
jgi:methionyl-tRNA synthetase